jgi:hypothetical protein
MDDFQKRFPHTVAMVASRVAAQNTKGSAQHIHQHGQQSICTAGIEVNCDCKSFVNNKCNGTSGDCSYKQPA